VAVVRAMVVTAYVLVALASVWFLRRIREQTPTAVLAAAVVALAGVGFSARWWWWRQLEADYPVSAIIVGLAGAGVLWWVPAASAAPVGATPVGVFDAAESADVLPGAGVFAPDANGGRGADRQGGRRRTLQAEGRLMAADSGGPADGRPTSGARRPRAEGVQKAFLLLEAVAQLGSGASARDISLLCGVPPATAYRLLNLLVATGSWCVPPT